MKDADAFADSPVPQALPRILEEVRARVGEAAVDTIWIFPPLVKGRREWGLLAFSLFTGDSGMRTLYTARYAAELTGTGMVFESELTDQGTAPGDRLPRIMDGVVRRSDLPLGEPREVGVAGDAGRFRSLVEEYQIEETNPGSSGRPE